MHTLLVRVRTLLWWPFALPWRLLRKIYVLQRREQQRLWIAMRSTSGLMPLLMKQRNGQKWTTEDRALLREQLKNLMEIGPYLILFIAPGAFLTLPLLAWWLDRRRQRRMEIVKSQPVE